MRRLLLPFVGIVSLSASAAIVTERNDWFIVPAPAVNFVGTSADPGIRSQWIPYGTYTDGTGDTEYLRVTSNLYGVVYSVWDGYFERQDASSGGDLSRSPNTNRMYRTTADGKRIYGCQDTLRIMDWLNVEPWGGAALFEMSLAHTYTSGDGSQYHSGASERYGSRKLDSLLTNAGYSIEPPISTNWFSSIPFRAADSNLWRTVWPTYSMLTNDIHFFPASTNAVQHYSRDALESWMYGWEMSDDEGIWHLGDIWGSDVYGYDEHNAGWALLNTLDHMPLPCDMEDVLSVDTGWKYEYPPVETNSFWEVSGPLGSFKLDYVGNSGGGTINWDNGASDPTDYYVNLWCLSSHFGLDIFDVSTFEHVYGEDVTADPETDTLYFGDYRADRTRLYNGDDDYAHWRNGTTRIDWKRLGILCQLERQMEISHYAATCEERLPFKSVSAERSKHGSATIHVTIPAPVHAGDTNLVILAGTDWHLEDRAPSISTNDIGWCYPTCRTPIPSFHYGTATLGVRSPLAVGWDDFTNRVYQSIDHSKVDAGASYWAVFEFSLEAFEPTPGSLFAKAEFAPYYITEDCMPGLLGYQWPLQGFDADIEVVCDMGKFVIAYYTTARPEQSSAIKEKFEAFPPVSAWNHGYVSRQRRPTLDVMISGTDSKSHADSTNTVPLKWSKEETLMERFFRMNPLCAETASRTASDNNRLEMLRDLDAEVKNKCVALGGIDVNILTNVANISAAEATEMVRRINGAGLPLSFGLAKSWEQDGYALLAINFGLKEDRSFDYIHIWAETGESSTELPQGEAIQFGTYGWSGVNSNPGSETPIGSYKDVRVDGHQNQMIKTLWKFKNLRDPNL